MTTNSKAAGLLQLIDEDGLNSVKSAIAKVLERVKTMALQSNLKVSTDLNALRDALYQSVDNQEHSHRTAPLYTLDPDKIMIGTTNSLKHENGVDKQEVFKGEFVKTMQSFISMLHTFKKNYPWIDVKEIVEPMLKIEVKPKS